MLTSIINVTTFSRAQYHIIRKTKLTPVSFATQDSLILVRSQSATSLVMVETWMGDRFGEKKNQHIYVDKKTGFLKLYK